ncbi:MAG TPA: phosphate ABC transporter permease subunit PstC [Thermomicrobiales bacterium]|nr:phosphate ABC transporter permease subunit PstC [Thermomicrobiales bacterium]
MHDVAIMGEPTVAPNHQPAAFALRSPRWAQSRAADRLFQGIVGGFAVGLVLLVTLIAVSLWLGSDLARQRFGWGFIVSGDWDPVAGAFGAAPYIFGTLLTALFALALAGPVGVGAALYLNDIAPGWLRTPIGFLVEMLAAIPSVIYGLWALFILVPFNRSWLEPALGRTFGFMPLFHGPPYGVGYLAAGLVLAIMILPTVTAIAQAVLAALPSGPREGAYALGATRWETIRGVSLPMARGGIAGALILGLGRALGETMAVTMVIGNRGTIGPSLFALGDTMASVIANQFSEASDALHASALIEIGLILFVVTVLLNLAARLLIVRLTADRPRRV